LDRGSSVRDWSAGRSPSRASPAPTGNVYTGKRSVGCQAAIAGKPAPTKSKTPHTRSCPSPLTRPSVSSPAAFDLDPPAPSGG
jgi:hypothetical protein